jgi:hypothetical protein
VRAARLTAMGGPSSGHFIPLDSLSAHTRGRGVKGNRCSRARCRNTHPGSSEVRCSDTRFPTFTVPTFTTLRSTSTSLRPASADSRICPADEPASCPHGIPVPALSSLTLRPGGRPRRRCGGGAESRSSAPSPHGRRLLDDRGQIHVPGNLGDGGAVSDPVAGPRDPQTRAGRARERPLYLDQLDER